MALTARSRLCCIKHKQKRLQRRQESENCNLLSAVESEAAVKPSLQPVPDLSTKAKAWKKYLHAKAIYEETKEIGHWRYMQKCLTEYEKLNLVNLGDR
ncbi:MAG TPA: hypothetical protein V6C85_34595 [Allocoleopsis sp.]